MDALVAFLEHKTLRSTFCSGEAGAFNAQMAALVKRHPRDAVIAALARSLPFRMDRATRERVAIWSAIEDALALERCLSEALQACCVAPGGLDVWLGPLRKSCELAPPSVLLGPNGEPIAWRIEGNRGK